jgi:hypothetical protein
MSRAATGAMLATLSAVLPLAGCGGSSPRSTVATTAATAINPATATNAATATSAATSETVTTSPTTTQATSPSATSGTIPSNNGAATAFLPADFFVAPDGSLSPRTIAAPAATTILLTVTSHATHPLTVAVAGHSLTVPANGHSSTKVAGLRPAHYPVSVDGARRAAIIVGASPGP